MMNAIHLLHNAARRYCLEQSHRWRRRYAELAAAGRDRAAAGNGYSEEAYGTFPRYNVLDAIREDVERFVPADFGSLEELREMLALAGLTAASHFTKADGQISADAMGDERRRFVEFVSDPDLDRLANTPELPFVRVLGTDEHQMLHRAFVGRWGKWYGGGREAADTQVEAVTLHTQVMEETGAYDLLRNVLFEHGITRVLELREWGESGCEIDTMAAHFTYTGAEGFWTSADMAWMVYASHESSITFGGLWLIDRMRTSLPKWDASLYRGWDPAVYPDAVKNDENR